jgi:hypothetical protein
VLAPAEALLLSGGDELPVDDEGRGGIVEDGVDAQDAHGSAASRKCFSVDSFFVASAARSASPSSI